MYLRTGLGDVERSWQMLAERPIRLAELAQRIAAGEGELEVPDTPENRAAVANQVVDAAIDAARDLQALESQGIVYSHGATTNDPTTDYAWLPGTTPNVDQALSELAYTQTQMPDTPAFQAPDIPALLAEQTVIYQQQQAAAQQQAQQIEQQAQIDYQKLLDAQKKENADALAKYQAQLKADAEAANKARAAILDEFGMPVGYFDRAFRNLESLVSRGVMFDDTSPFWDYDFAEFIPLNFTPGDSLQGIDANNVYRFHYLTPDELTWARVQYTRDAAGKWKPSSAVQFGKEQSSNFGNFLKFAAPLFLVAIPGVGQAIGAAAFSAVGATVSPAVAAAVGNVAISTALNGGDIERSVVSALAGGLGSAAGGFAGAALDSAAIGKIVSTLTTTAATGGDIKAALLSTVAQTGVSKMSDWFSSFDFNSGADLTVAEDWLVPNSGAVKYDPAAFEGYTTGVADDWSLTTQQAIDNYTAQYGTVDFSMTQNPLITGYHDPVYTEDDSITPDDSNYGVGSVFPDFNSGADLTVAEDWLVPNSGAVKYDPAAFEGYTTGVADDWSLTTQQAIDNYTAQYGTVDFSMTQNPLITGYHDPVYTEDDSITPDDSNYGVGSVFPDFGTINVPLPQFEEPGAPYVNPPHVGGDITKPPASPSENSAGDWLGAIVTGVTALASAAIKLVPTIAALKNADVIKSGSLTSAGAIVTANNNGTITTRNQTTGAVSTTIPAVGKAYQTPDGNIVTNNGNGTYTVVKPDGTRYVGNYTSTSTTGNLTTGAGSGFFSNPQNVMLAGGAALVLVLLMKGK